MKLTGKQCQCTVCGETFSTESNFNRHRVGTHGVDRKCLNPADVGLIRRDSGIWKLPGKEWRK